MIDDLRRLDQIIWATIAAVGCVVIASAVITSFAIDWVSFAKPAIACCCTAIGTFVYQRFRKNQAIADALRATGQVIIFAAVGAPLSYIAATARLPLRGRGARFV